MGVVPGAVQILRFFEIGDPLGDGEVNGLLVHADDFYLRNRRDRFDRLRFRLRFDLHRLGRILALERLLGLVLRLLADFFLFFRREGRFGFVLLLFQGREIFLLWRAYVFFRVFLFFR